VHVKHARDDFALATAAAPPVARSPASMASPPDGGISTRRTWLAPKAAPRAAQVSNDGASAARAGNLGAARASCGGCHGPYRAKYKSERRAAAIP
jgi:hypothetical protein